MRSQSDANRGSKTRQVAYTRFLIIVAGFVLWIGGIGVRLVYLQVTQHEALKERATEGRVDVKKQRMLRGSIFDRNGRALAMSLRAKTLYADAVEIEEIDLAAATIGKELKIDIRAIASEIREAKAANKRFLPIARKLDEETVQKLNKSLDLQATRKADLPNFKGLHWRDEQKRSYPQQSLAAQVVGFSNDEDEGVAGIEQSQNLALHGETVKKLQQRDRLGRVYDEEVTERVAPADIVLTIDSALQYMVEEELEAGVRRSGAKSGMAVVMSPKTGEILALANYPTFDPNTITEKSTALVKNHAIQSFYAPGSVFKIVTYGSGLEKRLFGPTDMISSGNGSIEVAEHVFRDSHGVGTVSYSQALAHSSNVCAIKTALSVGRDDFAGMMQKLGFGSKTGVELPAETSGMVRPVSKWYGDSLASMAIGYEIGVTALQMTTAFATIANNGVKVQPRIIKEFRREGEPPSKASEVQRTQAITAETARNLRTMLKQVVLTGTGRRAQLNGYTAAGKTGTAWKFNPQTKAVDPSRYTSSFIGMAPADDPELVIGIVMDEPTSGARDGGMVAAPVFREIAQRLLYEMKVPPDARFKQEQQIAREIPETPASDAPALEVQRPESPKTIKKDKPTPAPGASTKEQKIPELKKGKDKDKPLAEKSRTTAQVVRLDRWWRRGEPNGTEHFET